MSEFEHQVIDDAVQYVDGKIHTNGLENLWSLLKHVMNGTYASVKHFTCFYLDEQTYRFNNRKPTDGERFDLVVRGLVGNRVTFDQLTGKNK